MSPGLEGLYDDEVFGQRLSDDLDDLYPGSFASTDDVEIDKVRHWLYNGLYPVSVASSDGVAVDVTIDNTHYEGSQGCAFLLTLDDGDDSDTNSATSSAVQVLQVALDLSGADPWDLDGSIPVLAEQSEEFLSFAQQVAAAQGGDS